MQQSHGMFAVAKLLVEPVGQCHYFSQVSIILALWLRINECIE